MKRLAAPPLWPSKSKAKRFRLAAYAEKLRELNFPFAEAYDELVGRLLVGEIGTAAPKVGDAMPLFALPGRGGHLVALANLLRKGPVVVSFNRGHWCPFCKIELRKRAWTLTKFLLSLRR